MYYGSAIADSKNCWAKHKEEVLKAIEEKDLNKLHEMGLRVVATRQARHRNYLRRSAHSRKIQPLFEELWDAGEEDATITLKPVAMVLSKAGESRDSFRVLVAFTVSRRDRAPSASSRCIIRLDIEVRLGTVLPQRCCLRSSEQRAS